MISTRTTLVLGAGASLPYGYPSGAGLIRQIIQRLSTETGVNPNYYSELLELGFAPDLIRSFVRDLNNSGVRSIDEFLEHRKDYRQVGKTAIAQIIIGLEQHFQNRDPLFVVDARPDIQSPRWYPQLLAAMSATLEDFPQNQLNIITFNYDRSLEHYLYHALLAKYGPASENRITDILRAARILHVHGKLGNLPWQAPNNQRAYGVRKNLDELKASGELISIVYEGDRQSNHFERARTLMRDSERVIFLGFGYHRDNVRRLGISTLDPKVQLITGTRFGLTDLEVRDHVARTAELHELIRAPNVAIHDFLRQAVILDGVAAETVLTHPIAS